MYKVINLGGNLNAQKKRKSIKKVKLSDKSTKTYTATNIKYPRVCQYKLVSNIKVLI